MKNYQVSKIDEHTWKLEDPFRTYMYLAEGRSKAVLIDAGNGFSGLREVVSLLTDKPVTVILTHGHFDHTGAACEFPECYIHREDKGILEAGLEKKLREDQMLRFKQLFQVDLSSEEEEYLVNAEVPKSVKYFSDGTKIDLGGRWLEVIETPGHTHGSVCFLDKGNKYLFAGDTACNREILVYFEHSASVEDVMLSDEKLLKRKTEYLQIWPGHHECPMYASCLEDYRKAASDIIKTPGIGEKILLDQGYKILYKYKNIGISYIESHVNR